MSETLYESSRTHAHEGTVLLVAAQSMGVYINDADRLYIRTVSKLAAVIDDIVDNEGDFPDIAGILTDPVGRLSGRLSEKDTTVVLEGIHEFTARQQDTLMEAELLPEYADVKRSASTIRDLSAALSSEALLFTRLFSLDTGTTEDSNRREHFNVWLKHFSRGGYHVDGAVDLREDFKEGRVGVASSPRSQAYLWGIALHELRTTFTYVRSARFMYELGKTSLMTIYEGRRSDLAPDSSIHAEPLI